MEEGVQYSNQLEIVFCLTAIYTCREYQNHFKIVSFLNDKDNTFTLTLDIKLLGKEECKFLKFSYTDNSSFFVLWEEDACLLLHL